MAEVERDILQARIRITRTGNRTFSVRASDPLTPFERSERHPEVREPVEEHRYIDDTPVAFQLRPLLPQSIWIQRVDNEGFRGRLSITYSETYPGNPREVELGRFSFVTDRRGAGRNPDLKHLSNEAHPNKHRYCLETEREDVRIFECIFPILAEAPTTYPGEQGTSGNQVFQQKLR